MHALPLATGALLVASPLVAQRAPGADDGGPARLTAGYSIFWVNPIVFASRPGSALLPRGLWWATPALDVGLSVHFWGRLLVPGFSAPGVTLGVVEEDVTSYLGTAQLRLDRSRRVAVRGGLGLSRFVLEEPRGGLLVATTTNPATTLFAGAAYELPLLGRTVADPECRCDSPAPLDRGQRSALGTDRRAEVTPFFLRIGDSSAALAIRVIATNPGDRDLDIVSGGPPYSFTADPGRSRGLEQSCRIATAAEALNAGPGADF